MVQSVQRWHLCHLSKRAKARSLGAEAAETPQPEGWGIHCQTSLAQTIRVGYFIPSMSSIVSLP